MPTRTPLHVASLALLALLVVAAPAAGQGSPAASGSSAPCSPVADEPAFADETQVQAWSGDVPADADGGILAVQSYHAGAYLVPWNESAWKVEVGQADPNDELQVTVDASTDDAFSLDVAVEPRSQLGGLPLDPSDAYAQVKAWVPHRVYEDLTLRDTPNASQAGARIQTSPTQGSGWDALVAGNATAGAVDVAPETVDAHLVGTRAGDLLVSADSQDGCLAGVDAGTANVTADSGDLGLGDLEADALEFGADSGNVDADLLQAKTLRLHQDSGDARLRNVTASQATLRSGSGDVTLDEAGLGDLVVGVDSADTTLAGVTASSLNLTVDSGDLVVNDSNVDRVDAAFRSGDTRIDGLTAEELFLQADSGDLTARGVEARNLDVTMDSGDVDAEVKPAGNGTWNVSADSGSVALHVPAGDAYGYDAVLTTDSGEPRIDIPETEVVSRSEHRLHVRTVDFQDRPIRTTVGVTTDSGDVTTDDELETDEAAFGSDGRTYGVVPSTPQQAVADAGILAALAAVAAVAWPKVRPLVAPFYSRIGAHEVLEHPVRSEIHGLVQEEPGLHFREIQRRLEAGRGVLEHHLDKLVDANVLAAHEAEGYTCYFVQGSVEPDLVEVAPLLRTDTARDLLAAAAEAPGASVNALSEAADVSNSTASYHLDKLAEAGLVAKDRGANGLEVTPTDLGRRALDELALEAELKVSGASS